MIQYYSHVMKMPIVGHHGSSGIAYVRNLILDYENGKIVAVETDKPDRFISAVDILSWNRTLLVIDDSVLVPLKELVRVKQIIEQGIRFIGQQVVTRSGNTVGILHDFSFETDSAMLLTIEVCQFFLWWKYDNRIISAKDIVEVTKNAVVIRETTTKQRALMKESVMEPI